MTHPAAKHDKPSTVPSVSPQKVEKALSKVHESEEDITGEKYKIQCSVTIGTVGGKSGQNVG